MVRYSFVVKWIHVHVYVKLQSFLKSVGNHCKVVRSYMYSPAILVNAFCECFTSRIMNGNRPEDSSLFHPLTGESNVVLDCDGIWRIHVISISH